jgi:1-acyl-sn-glycerol-3-phosphate acyltransferase
VSIRRALAGVVLRLWGWTIEGSAPTPPKYVLIAAPHTSNWDFIFLIAYAWYFGVEISWLGKREMFRGPFAVMFTRLGGIPVARDEKGNMVDRMAELFASRDRFCLVVPVEGTRGYVEYWKSGFYHVARAARVPIVMSYLDYPNKLGGFGPALLPTGDIPRDMNVLREFYREKRGKHVDWTGRIRLKEEDLPTKATA